MTTNHKTAVTDSPPIVARPYYRGNATHEASRPLLILFFGAALRTLLRRCEHRPQNRPHSFMSACAPWSDAFHQSVDFTVRRGRREVGLHNRAHVIAMKALLALLVKADRLPIARIVIGAQSHLGRHLENLLNLCAGVHSQLPIHDDATRLQQKPLGIEMLFSRRSLSRALPMHPNRKWIEGVDVTAHNAVADQATVQDLRAAASPTTDILALVNSHRPAMWRCLGRLPRQVLASVALHHIALQRTRSIVTLFIYTVSTRRFVSPHGDDFHPALYIYAVGPFAPASAGGRHG